MRLHLKLAAATAAALMSATAAFAADPAPLPPAATTPPPPPAFSWDRYYVGAYGGWWNCCGEMLGVYAGRNFTVGERLVVGIDLMVGGYDFSAWDWEAYALGRIGITLGQRALLFGAFGAGFDGGAVMAAAAGVEVAIGSNASLRAEVLLYDVFDSPDIAGVVGFAWHFGD